MNSAPRVGETRKSPIWPHRHFRILQIGKRKAEIISVSDGIKMMVSVGYLANRYVLVKPVPEDKHE